MDDKPAFEIRDVRTGRWVRIWANGRVEGVDEPFVVINRIPIIVGEAVQSVLEDEAA